MLQRIVASLALAVAAAPDRTTVDEFHEAARAGGHRSRLLLSEGWDGGRVYSGCVEDPDGNWVESVFRELR